MRSPRTLLAVLSIVVALVLALGGEPAALAAQAAPSNSQDVPDTPGQTGYTINLPFLTSSSQASEILEVSAVQLDENKPPAAVTEKHVTEQPAQGPQLDPPPPGLEVYPAQADNKAASSSVQAPTATDAVVTLVDEGFEGPFPPTGSAWRVFDNNGVTNGEYFWDDDDFMASSGSWSAWVANGGKNGLDPQFYNYPNNLQSWMVYGPFDLSNATSASLTFTYWNSSELNYDFLGWYASGNGTNFFGNRVSGNSGGWKSVTLDLAAVPGLGNLLGDPSVWIAFVFTSDGNITGKGAFVDQIRVQKQVNVPCIDQVKGEYFNNKTLSGTPTLVTCENWPINYNWGTGSPAPGIGTDNFSVRWTGTAQFSAGTYNFVALSDDGIRVWLDNVLIINAWRDQGPTPYLVNRVLTAGAHTIKVEYYENTGAAIAQFRWLRSATQASKRQGFDTCALPTTSQMQTWWASSPYDEVNLYIGGINRGCNAHNQQNLTDTWVATVRAQGWNFIPTWVGLQAPCSTDANLAKMSSNATTAYAQGRQEADAAANAAQKLGLTTADRGGTLIYYVMAPYPNNTSCRQTVKSFISGWVNRLHELGNQAGGFGASCASFLSDWAQLSTSMPDHIWAAHWIYPAYNATATVSNVACLANNLWSNHQRIRQYAGAHNETWGTVRLNIDSNVLDGQVAGTNVHAAQATADSADMQVPLVQVTAFDLISARAGWVISQDRLLWTDDAGSTWADHSPRDLHVRAASFLNATSGWVVAAGTPDAENRSTLYLGKTEDSGLSWTMNAITAFAPLDPNSTQGEVTLTLFDVNDMNQGLIQVQLASISTFEEYALFKTDDGGMTWHEISPPTGGPVHFTDPSNGWTVATANHEQTYVTYDGGNTWSPAEALLSAAQTVQESQPQIDSLGALAAGVVGASFVDSTSGWVFVDHGLCSGTKTTAEDASPASEPFGCVSYQALLATQDGGSTWSDITPEGTP